jgi:hypothetical protein
MIKSNGGIIGPDNVTTGGPFGSASGVFKLGEVTDLIKDSKWPTAGPASYQVANSLRFNDGSSDYLNKTLGTASNRKIFTVSYWIKKTTNGLHTPIVEVASSGGSIGGSENAAQIYFNTSDQLTWYETHGGGVINLSTNRLFRDPNAWYHIMYAIDTTQGTSTNRLKLFVNGTQDSSFTSGSGTYPSENLESYINSNQDATYIGRSRYSNKYFDGYMCEVVHVDGTAQGPTDLGEFDEDSPNIWKPKNVSGLTFGTNGFYLDFEDSSALGNDAAGSNNFTVNNLTAIDQSTDTCTNNSATIGTLFMGLNTPTFSEGNLQSYSSAAGLSVIPSSIGLASGKWYAELKYAATTSNDNTGIGINMDPASSNQQNTEQGGYTFGYSASTGGYTPYQAEQSGSGATYTVGDIMGIYMDLDNMKLYFSKNGTLNSSTGLTINTSNTGFYYFCVQDYTSTSNFWTWQWNFGTGS